MSCISSPSVPAKIHFYGIFDGHGGRTAAQFASKSLLDNIVAQVRVEEAALHEGSISSSLNELGEEAVGPHERRTCGAQEAIVDRLPQALRDGFQRTDAEFKARHETSGTTATVALVCGWDLVVANVGDSVAYFDTGASVLLVSANHRLDDNEAERRRLQELGGQIAQAAIERKAVGPLRVWPGGLAMGRSIGDKEAGDRVTADPDVRHMVIPLRGGRLIVASDGLWDALNAKSAAHSVRGLTPDRAAHALVNQAMKRKESRDDVTVIVVDFAPAEDAKVPPVPAPGAAPPSVHVWSPLSDHADKYASQWRANSAKRRVEAWETARGTASLEGSPREGPDAREAPACAAPPANAPGSRAAAPGSLYEELLGLKVDPLALAAEESECSEPEIWEAWLSVPLKKGKDRPSFLPGAEGRGRGRGGRVRCGLGGARSEFASMIRRTYGFCCGIVSLSLTRRAVGVEVVGEGEGGGRRKRKMASARVLSPRPPPGSRQRAGGAAAEARGGVGAVAPRRGTRLPPRCPRPAPRPRLPLSATPPLWRGAGGEGVGAAEGAAAAGAGGATRLPPPPRVPHPPAPSRLRRRPASPRPRGPTAERVAGGTGGAAAGAGRVHRRGTLPRPLSVWPPPPRARAMRRIVRPLAVAGELEAGAGADPEALEEAQGSVTVPRAHVQCHNYKDIMHHIT